MLGKYEKASEDFTSLIDQTPSDMSLYLNRGLSELKLFHFDKAYQDFTEVISGDPELASAYYNRATASIGLKNEAGACQDMRHAARLGFKEAFTHIPAVCK